VTAVVSTADPVDATVGGALASTGAVDSGVVSATGGGAFVCRDQSA
jgi:hypothetical protein